MISMRERPCQREYHSRLLHVSIEGIRTCFKIPSRHIFTLGFLYAESITFQSSAIDEGNPYEVSGS